MEPVEGQPRGLLLRLAVDMDLEPGGTLVVERRIGDGQIEEIRTIELSEERIAQIRGGKVEFLDRAVEAGARHHYRLRHRPPASDQTRAAGVHTSPTLTLTWREPPTRPKRIAARQVGDVVELAWEPVEFGAVIFRRNVLEEGSGIRRIATVGPGARGQLVDRDVRPNGVYAYQIALSTTATPFPQFGPPSEPFPGAPAPESPPDGSSEPPSPLPSEFLPMSFAIDTRSPPLSA